MDPPHTHIHKHTHTRTHTPPTSAPRAELSQEVTDIATGRPPYTHTTHTDTHTDTHTSTHTYQSHGTLTPASNLPLKTPRAELLQEVADIAAAHPDIMRTSVRQARDGTYGVDMRVGSQPHGGEEGLVAWRVAKGWGCGVDLQMGLTAMRSRRGR